ncbi:hypothetical protein T492DRAFT_322349 [Pavlovales sp. CCMP2436]|nr:hypothetical protein T492DRAFT_322349 [Pavlovales sp. CCMP2436]
MVVAWDLEERGRGNEASVEHATVELETVVTVLASGVVSSQISFTHLESKVILAAVHLTDFSERGDEGAVTVLLVDFCEIDVVVIFVNAHRAGVRIFNPDHVDAERLDEVVDHGLRGASARRAEQLEAIPKSRLGRPASRARWSRGGSGVGIPPPRRRGLWASRRGGSAAHVIYCGRSCRRGGG